MINVVDAIYGHLQTDICSSQHFDKACSTNGLSVVSDRLLKKWPRITIRFRCDSQQSCSIHASNANFGDPCGGIRKQLYVGYTCIGKCHSDIQFVFVNFFGHVMSSHHSEQMSQWSQVSRVTL